MNKIQQERLKDCPFCGGAAHIYTIEAGFVLNHFSSCPADISKVYATYERAKQVWNTRSESTTETKAGV